MVIIGIIGRMGSGKTEVVEYLSRRYGMRVVRLRDLVRQYAAREGLAPTRENLHLISKHCVDRCGADHLVRQALQRAAETPDVAVAATGLRTPADVVAFRRLGGEDFLLTHVETVVGSRRFERLRKRALERDPRTYHEFLRMDAEEERRFRISEAIRYADRTIRNDASRAELYEQIERVLVQPVLAFAS